MTRITRWHTAWRWALAACWLVGSFTAVFAQDGRWERVTAAGVQAVAQGDYAEAVRQFQAALPLADAGSLSTSRMDIAPCGRTLKHQPLYQGPDRCALDAYVPRLITCTSS